MKDKGVKCETCEFKFKDGVRCVIDPTICGSYKPKIQNTVTYMPSQFNPVPDEVMGDKCRDFCDFGANCKLLIEDCPTARQHQSKPDKVLGDTVVKKEINCETCRADCVVPIGKRINQPVPLWCSAYQSEFDKVLGDIIFACVGCPNKSCCDIRDTHTRSEIGRFLENNNVISLMPGQKSNLGLMLTAEVYQRLIKELEELCQTKK